MPRPAPIAAATDDHPEIAVMPVADLMAALKDGSSCVAVLDVRTEEEYTSGYIAGAKHVPSERLLAEAGEALAKEIIADFVKAGIKTIVVHCMYSQSDEMAATIANTLAAFAKVEGQLVEIAVLGGGFHEFFNTVHDKEKDCISDVPGLVEGVKSKKWRRTITNGLVEATTVEAVEVLMAPTKADD